MLCFPFVFTHPRERGISKTLAALAHSAPDPLGLRGVKELHRVRSPGDVQQRRAVLRRPPRRGRGGAWGGWCANRPEKLPSRRRHVSKCGNPLSLGKSLALRLA